MDLTFAYHGADYHLEELLEFLREDQPAFWSEPFFYCYPEIDRAAFYALPAADRLQWLRGYFARFEEENAALLQAKVRDYNLWWQTNRSQVTAALEDAFGTPLADRFNDLRAAVTFNPVSPRFLCSHSFDVFYKNRPQGALGVALHEIVHFVWFAQWQALFADNPAEYEAPHLKWILSEMVTDTVMRDERLTSLNPYQQHGGTAYPYFYTMKIDGAPVLETLYALYRALPMDAFMQQAYEWCCRHEAEIRRQIAASEQNV